VYAIAQFHGVAPLVFANLMKCPGLPSIIPAGTLNRFRSAVLRTQLTKGTMARQIGEVLAFLNSKALDMMLIKGAALDLLVYEHPRLTVSADVDLVCRNRGDEVPEKDRREISAFLRGYPLVEYEWFAHHDVLMNGALRVDFQQIWQEARPWRVHGQNAFVMSPEDLLITACINGCRKRFVRLKALCDIAETVQRSPLLSWTKLIQKARAYQCNDIVFVALSVTSQTLGCQVPPEVLDALPTSRWRAVLLRCLSRRRARCPLTPTARGIQIGGKTLDWSLVLPYATYRWRQVWQHVGIARGLVQAHRRQERLLGNVR
jgi:hypothetical protein